MKRFFALMLALATIPNVQSIIAAGSGLNAASADALRAKAEAGDAAAQAQLGMDYAEGKDGVSKDYTQAMTWFRKSADQGNAFGERNFGICYSYGLGVAKDDAEAAKWYEKAGNHGDLPAQIALANMYAQGKGVAKDDATSVKWMQLAAQQGSAYAQGSLGLAYSTGKGVAKDTDEAIKWLRAAALQGEPGAEYSLGATYALLNYDEEKNQIEGLAWIEIAAESGDERITKNRDKMEEHYGHDITQAAQDRVKALKAELAEAKAKKAAAQPSQ